MKYEYQKNVKEAKLFSFSAKLRVLVILCALPLSISYLSAQNTENYQLTWFQYKGTIRLAKHFKLALDIQHRRQEFLTYSSQQVFRPGITYAIKNDVNLTVGTALFWHNITVEKPVYRFEVRPYTFLEWKQPLGKTMITHRSRFELRYNRKTNDGLVLEGFDFNYRAGHKMGLSIPVRIGIDPDWRIELYDEVLINFGERIKVNYLDQNRMYLGVKKLLSNTMNVKLGYMYIFVPTSNPQLRVHFHTIVLGFSQSF